MFERVLRLVIERRAQVILVTLLVAAFGAICLNRLPIDAVPDITNNQVVINTFCPGLAPEEVEKQITFPLETALAGLPSLQHTRSLSRNEFSQITAVFEDRANPYFMRQLVQERLTESRERLPSDVAPHLGPVSTGLGEVLMWVVEFEHPDKPFTTPAGRTLESEQEKAMYLRELQEWLVRPQIRAVPGVADVDSIGGARRQFVVEVDPGRLTALGVQLEDLLGALEHNNLNTGAGTVEIRGQALTVRAQGRLNNEREIEEVTIAERHGTPIRVSDIGNVRLGPDLRTGSASQGGVEVVVGTAMMRIGENSRVVSHAVAQKIAQTQKTLPAGVRLRIVLNRMQLVDATVETVRNNLAEGALLVIFVLFLTLGNLRAAVIVAAAIPLSMLFTAIGMQGLGLSGNLMSLGAIDFGLIVDGSVIIVENSLRVLATEERRLGRTLTLSERLDAVYRASSSVRNATAYGEAIIVLVYIPILFLSGVEGKMFQPMAITVILALTAAFVLSLTFVPAAVALFLTGKVEDRENQLIVRLRSGYLRLLGKLLDHGAPMIGVSVGCLVLAFLLFGRLGQEFVPTLDEKNLAMHSIRPPGTGIEQSTRLQREVEKIILGFPEVQRVFSKTGTADLAADPMPPNVSDTFIMLHPDKTDDKAALVERLDKAVRILPGHEFEFTQPIQMRFNELISGVRSDVAIKVFGDDFAKLSASASEIAAVLRAIPGAKDVRVEQISGLPTLSIEPKREALGRFGLDVRELHREVATGIRGREAGTVLEGDRSFPIVVRFAESMRGDLDSLSTLPIQLPGGAEQEKNPHRYLPLSALANIEMSTGLNQVSRENGKRRVVVQCNVRGRDLGGFVEEAQHQVSSKVQLDPGNYLVWGGQYENLLEAQARLRWVVPMCLLMILVFLYASFGAFGPAALVFVGVPLALPGGVLALWLRDMPFSISAAVGFIALSGVAVLNGLVLVTFIQELRAEGMPARPALEQACALRFRPILMTALVAALGFIPMALSAGTGAEVQRPLATVVIGGLCTTTPLILFVLPALYQRFPALGKSRAR
jgi:heavy metal efflux system protein